MTTIPNLLNGLIREHEPILAVIIEDKRTLESNDSFIPNLETIKEMILLVMPLIWLHTSELYGVCTIGLDYLLNSQSVLRDRKPKAFFFTTSNNP